MLYAEQRRFLDRYNREWIVAALALVLTAIWTAHSLGGILRGAWFLLATVLVTLTLWYQPKYLHIHHEPDRRYIWAVRARWILITSLTVIALFANLHQPDIARRVLIPAVWMLAVNAFVKTAWSRERWLAYRWMPPIYFLGDLLAFLFLSAADAADPFVIIALLLLSVEFALALNADFGIGFTLSVALFACVFVAAFNCATDRTIYFFPIVLVAAASTARLTAIARTQARRNHDATSADLAAFAEMNPAQTEARLLSSRGMLAQSWKNAHLDESNKAALAQWYSDNSLSYLFDIARFHLTYKHIMFSLDVLGLSRGRCLDYGAGKGELAINLARSGCAVTYFDVPGRSCDYAGWNAQRSGLTLTFTSRKEEIMAEVAARGKYDTILSLDVLEHLPDLGGELEFLASVLAPGGRMILTVPEGATESHPMHLSHRISTEDFLCQRGLRNARTWRIRLTGSEILRKPSCVIMQLPA
jgi:2-polyprenyl-3-methyl-5-hydroxy-6-metoxy-1,4-benzoquinol methylase